MTERGRFAALIRHGDYHQQSDAPSALQPHPLTENGRAQAINCGKEVSKILQDNGWDLDPLVHSSTELRAWETACLALQQLGVAADIQQSHNLSERSVGSVANLTVDQIEAVLRKDPRYEAPRHGWKSDAHYCLPFPGAESLSMAGKRVADHINHSLPKPPTTQRSLLTLFFGHGASFRHAACHMGVLQPEDLPRLSMHHAKPLLICYNFCGSWSHFGGAWKIRNLADPITD
jgi:2,3-bisphosphoglycerate-dependent phosphoglycerate mutase